MRGKKIESVYVDNCCHVSKKLKLIFGPDVNVKLDLFHAVQRVLRTVSNRHPLYSRFLKELRHCFRQSGDNIKERTMNTPSATEISNNLKSLNSRWDILTYKEKRLLNSKTQKEINNLIIHAEKGCLSDIPPGAGTAKNENLHGHINKFLYRKRIGIKLAFALFTKAFAKRNENIHSDIYEGTIVTEQFGFQRKETSKVTKKEIKPVKEFTTYEISDMIRTAENELAILTCSEEDNNLTYLTILHKCFIIWLFYLSLRNTKLHDLMNVRSIPFLFNAKPAMSDGNSDVDTVLNLNGFQMQRVNGDGNCFFSSVLLALKNIATVVNLKDGIMINLQEITATEFITKLRERLVDEWVSNAELYIGQTSYEFDEYINEANKFLHDGFFNSELGDTMVNCLSNALGVVIILFSDNGMPMQVLSPAKTSQYENPICLVHSSLGNGHYDAATFLKKTEKNSVSEAESVNFETSELIKENESIKGCSCGKNDKMQTERCSITKKYKSRCPCLLNKKKCTEKCKCKGCQNGRAMKRVTEALGREPISNKYETSLEFAANKGEDVSNLGLNFVEYFLLHEIKRAYLEKNDEHIHSVYNCICRLANELFDVSPLQSKSLKDIRRSIKSWEINREIVKSVNAK